MRPELPFLAAGAVALVGAVLRDGKLPSSLSRPAIGVAVLVILAAATQRTKAAPVVNAFGMLMLTGVVIITGQILYDRLKSKKFKGTKPQGVAPKLRNEGTISGGGGGGSGSW